jgi:hypothetical protein
LRLLETVTSRQHFVGDDELAVQDLKILTIEL